MTDKSADSALTGEALTADCIYRYMNFEPKACRYRLRH